MLEKSEAFSSFAVQDLDAARRFYGETLGLDVTDEPMGLLGLHLAGGTDIMIYPQPDSKPPTYTVLNFPVDDIENAVDELTRRGVTMTRYDGFSQDDKGISRDERGPQIAWFTDPSGNVLSVLKA